MTELLRQYNIADDDGVILLSIVMLALYSFVLFRGRETLAHKWKVFFSGRQASGGENLKDNGTDIQNNIILLIILCMSVGILFFDRISGSTQQLDFGHVFAIAGILMAWIVVKGIAYCFINWVFTDDNKNSNWISAYYYLISLFSLLVFPFALSKIFFELDCSSVVFLSLIMLAFYKFLLFCKLIIIFKPKNYGILLIFLYFCTLELMPLFLMWHSIV